MKCEMAADQVLKRFPGKILKEDALKVTSSSGAGGLEYPAPIRSPRRPLPGVQDYFNRKGVISDQGEKKEVFYVLQKAYLEASLGDPVRAN